MQFQLALSRATDPLSSHAAADAIRPVHADQCDRVYRFLTLHPGLTTWELAHLYRATFSVKDKSVDWLERMFGRRLNDLRNDGMAVVGPDKKTKYSKTAMQTWTASSGVL